jgi:hypothetical protein
MSDFVTSSIGPRVARALILFGLLAAALPAATLADHSRVELLSTGPVGGNGSPAATYVGASTIGDRVFFQTAEKLVASDTDSNIDVYERAGATTTLVSVGPTGGNAALDAEFDGLSSDGTKVFFHTEESLVAADTDVNADIYQRSAGTTTILSQGPAGGNAAIDTFWVGNTADGSKVWFVAYEPLVAEDGDSGRKDIYQYQGGTVTLISTGPQTDGPYGADFEAASTDGTKVFFHTQEALTNDDTDGNFQDLYRRSGSTTDLVSTGPVGGGGGGWRALFGGISTDGNRAFFQTAEQLVSEDTDSTCPDALNQPILPCSDVYEWSSGTTNLVSTGPTVNNGDFRANFRGSTPDGAHVFFTTDEALVAADTDTGCPDAANNPTRPCIDVYDRSGGATTLVSTSATSPDGPYKATYWGTSQNGSKVWFGTDEPLEAADTDSAPDLYERSGGTTTTRLSTSPTGGNGFFNADFLGASQDGSRVFFTTFENLTPNDTDANWQDIYERFNSNTYLVSTGPAATNGATFPNFAGSTPDGKRVFMNTDEPLVASDTNAAIDVFATKVPDYETPKEATPLSFSLVPAYRQTISASQCVSRGGTVSSHGAPLALTSCNPPGVTPGAKAFLGRASVGNASYTVLPGNLSTVADEADVTFSISLSDVRLNNATGVDYDPNPSGADGTLLAKTRFTDYYNTSAGQLCAPTTSCPATTTDSDFPIPMTCVATADPSVGANCTGSESADAAIPGVINEYKATVMEMFRTRVNDAGANGIRNDADDRLFAQQGLYIP